MLAATARNKRGLAAIEWSMLPSHEVREKRPFRDK
jgi:hypothetical protein